MGVWLLAQMFAQLLGEHEKLDLILIQLASAISPWIAVAFYYLSAELTNIKIKRYPSRLLLSVATIFSTLNFSGLLIKSAHASSGGIVVDDAGLLYFVEIAFIALLFLSGLYRVLKSYLVSSGKVKRSSMLLLIAVTQAVVLVTIGSTLFANNAVAQYIIPISALVLVLFVTVGIFRHGLFEIRSIVARAVSYVITIITIAGLTSIFLALVLNKLLDLRMNINQTLATSLIIALASSLYKYINVIFNKLSNKLFFQNPFNHQEVINEVNTAIVKGRSVDQTLMQVSNIVSSMVGLQNSRFIINHDDLRVGKPTIDDNLIEHIRLNAQENKLLRVGETEDTNVKQYMIDGEIDIIVSLTVRDKIVGVYEIGSKKSGGLFSVADERLFEIIGDETAIYIQNALQFEEIQKFNETLQAKVDDATRKLQRTNDKLKQLDETKDEFISMASHQLRTPLTSVKGYLSMVLEGDVGTLNDMQRKLLMQSFNSSQRMVYLISDLLNLSRLRTGKFIIEPKVTNLADVIEGEVEQLSANAKGRGLTLNYNKPKNFPDLYMDETKIRQVIMNFADNAIYYTPSGGKIDINLVNNKDTIEFTVVDNGIGVPLADQKHMFTKFYRAKNAQKARPDGTGLGIFMAKKVIIAQGGALIFESKPDKGSTFGFSISKSGLKVPE